MKLTASNPFLHFMAPAGLICLVCSLSPVIAASIPATPATQVGDTITDPNTGADVVVKSLITYKDVGLTTAEVPDPDAVVYVVTDSGKAILARTADNAVIFKVDPASGNPVLDGNNKGILYQVKTRTLDAGTSLVTGVTVFPNGGDPTVTSSQNASFAVVVPPADPPNPPETPVLGSSGPVDLVWRGAGGSNGHVGAIFVPAGDGGNGSNGPANNQTVALSYGNISATNVPGIRVASIGGDGGKGGNSYVNLAGGGGDGGYAGSGGTVNLTNLVDLTVTGNNASGILAYSQSGRGGVGGDGVLALGGGGDGGQSRNGGPVTVNNFGNISTNGTRSHGITALSSGGTAGSGGNAFGLVGVGGSGSKAGNGGAVSITNNASITTWGYASHGILAQSIGGTGGDGGVGAGVLAFSGDGSTGGTGGSVTVTLNAGSNIATFGELSSGVVAQSIGGGGGDSGFSGGIAAFGGTGGAGNHAGIVTVTAAAGTAITTDRNFSSGIVAQSIGGGGGSGGSTGGLVALNLGGSNSGGGNGNAVTVQNGGRITTSGEFSRGIFAQSIGGGGGSAGDAGGLIALGGKGSAGGASGKVIVGNNGIIHTDGGFSQGILAQSIAGGGGSGGNAGGLVSIGGKSTTGGHSETVTVSNSGSVTTLQARSDGILAQSIGGGGGNAGSGVGVVAIGGSGADAAGGNANTVTVANTGGIRTHGMDSRGIYAQAVGGGGGNGGAGTAGGLFVGFSLGGNGGIGGDGAKVSVSLDQSGALPALSRSFIETSGDRSVGILAQSVGGGGGSGGDSITGTVGLYGSVSVAIGGDGAGGGKGGEVELSGSGRITTTGEMAHGVLLESVGGGGGNGGMSVAAALAVGDVGAAAVGVSLGGGAGAGGDGGKVTVNDSNILVHTSGLQSAGFIAQSVGGGGGSGGMAISAAAAASAGASGAFTVGLGGDGEAGGTGGILDVTLGGSITTTKAQSDGILIQSVGGGGGNGGMTVAGSLGLGAAAAGAISVGVGGSGSGGGNAGAVTANITSDIVTHGEGSDALIIQAVGGGGGNGGLSIAAGLAGAGVGAGSVTLGIGGSGAGGGTGNVVNATYDGTVLTQGSHSTGILAQSVGGGGGNGGGAVSANLNGAGTGAGGVALAMGGKGSGGGDGGAAGIDLAVRLVTSGGVTTLGESSSAIVAQSIGGGGGNGGFSVAAVGSGAGTGAGSVSVGLGGSGGGGGDGKRVEAVIDSVVSTFSDNSGGVLAQSVGGGGGNGGFNISASGAGAGTGSGAVSVGLGGNGGTAGLGGSVDARSTGRITTRGANSSGFVAQSIGGGGGNGGFNVSGTISGAGTGSGAVSVGLGGGGAGGGAAGAVFATTSADVLTFGNVSTGILAQSVGGGGGNGGFNISATLSGAGTGSGAIGVGLGGSGAGGGDGSTVDLTVRNNVSTGMISLTNEIVGHDSSAVVAQSIGGGGGNGGFNVTVAGSAAGTGSGSVGVGIGGRGAGGGDGDRVTSTMTGDISTMGNNANGLMVQSVGGGGGNGGFDVTASISAAGTGSGALGVGIGGSAGSGGDSGLVTSMLTGDVITRGNHATGVTAQSLGGGGGNGGFNVTGTIAAAGTGSGGVSVGIGGSGGSGGDSGIVNNTVIGDVSTRGIGSGGVLAQSLGGGGGNGGFSISGTITAGGSGTGAVSVGIGGSGGGGGDSKAVTNLVTGNVITSNSDAFGILAQSVGGGGGNGGMNVSGAIGLSKTAAGALAVGIGGSGGLGGDAGTVDNTVSGYTQTTGLRSAGITTQSLGGGGGNGGLNVAATLTAAKTGSGGLAVGVGGFGGLGGEGRKATSTVTGGVVTTGDHSVGILTQSLGGGGGNGAINISAALNLTKENGGALGVGIGGFGGEGGNAGEVRSTVTTTSLYNQIATTGDDSSAIMAQSIGGGGGNGGLNVTGLVNLTGKNGAAIGVGVGGFGGGAGNAGKVTLSTTGDVFTQGNNSNGLMAQSIGGGGGNGGTSITGALAITKDQNSSTVVSASIGVGGFGGGGGNAGNVEVDYSGTLIARPSGVTDGSNGLMAQSIGGGGGNGGVNISAGLAYASKKADGHALLVGVGGFGGTGGNAGTVNVDVTGNNRITSYGDGRSAILASSIGGGGGNGGLNVSGGISSDSPIIVGVGGMGGNGGTGGNVDVDAATDLFTGSQANNTTNSAGLMAQSIGGGGGNGGLNVSGGIALSKEETVPSITFGIGGFGGAGAISGNVNAAHSGIISTSGGWTHGLFAQSIAGGGGNGALNISGQINFADSENSGGKTDLSIVAGLGGHGGLGADAGSVTVRSTGNISTLGDYSRGILAQSIGGGGGNGGMNVSGVFAKNSSPIVLGVGGFGSGGGHAGAVAVTRGTLAMPGGNILTDGIGATGIEASSIGGGGGTAGMNFNIAVSKADNKASTGSGGSGGSGGTRPKPQHTGVDDEVFTNYDSVLDELEGRAPADDQDSGDANKSSAFAAQIAIGGAGGEAGNGAAVKVDHYGNIETMQGFSHGILAQSIGGGGGNATLNYGYTKQLGEKETMGFNLAVGGQPGNAGNGGKVDVLHVGNIWTHGDNSYGVFAQSIGGGGGNVGVDEIKFNAKEEGGKIGITIGRIGGTGGSAGDVTLSSDGIIMTEGNTSYGLLAQSVGNGGGNSSSTSVSVGIPEKDEEPARAASISVGLEGGLGGSAGNVLLTAKGSVSTLGMDSHAIFAQSIGGGGGNAGDVSGTASTISLAIGGTGGEGGTGGNVTVDSSAEVRTKNKNSVGILAQSVGGAGGTGSEVKTEEESDKGSSVSVNVGGSGGTGMTSGIVTVSNSGVIVTAGSDSHGVLAQSIGGGGGNAGVLVNKITNKDATEATNISLSVGGTGGDGADSGKVIVSNSSGIGTSKINSIGIFAQSIGGGGGNASSITTETLSSAGAGNKLSLSIGRSGGTGGTGGDVSVSNLEAGRIHTLGDYSHGILAMSVGGGGGTGTTSITSNKSEGETNSATTHSLAFSLGGSGGTGGTGGSVIVNNDGTITTRGYKAHGIVAQSIGGGGGSGGVSTSGDLAMGGSASQGADAWNSSIAIGGQGGSGNRGGDVTVHNAGGIEVFGNESYGIYAQSIGGGGGDGGVASNNSTNLTTNPIALLEASALDIGVGNIGFGGTAGDGADSGNVLVNHSGTIVSHGNDSFGIFAQTVGGGGGRVGTSITSPVWTAADLTISTLMGGRDGAAGQAGTVTVDTTGDIVMRGSNSRALFTQSVNGGGGELQFFLDASKTAVALGAGGVVLPPDPATPKFEAEIKWLIDLGGKDAKDAAGSVIEAIHNGGIRTAGDKSAGSQTQSIGGGGGNAVSEIIVDDEADVDLVALLGGKDVSNSSGGAVSGTRTGGVVTTGDHSQGLQVQSIGGGGGNLNAGLTVVPGTKVALATARDLTTSPAAPLAGGNAARVSLGADAGFGNHGGSLALNYSGDVVTSGGFSNGLVVQSIGAGGGQSRITGYDSLKLALGATGASSGNGGNIVLSNDGAIQTSSRLSHGIVIQSIGGGGGLQTTDLNPARVRLTLNADNTGDGGRISFKQTGDIGVSGRGSVGIFAQSLGGGGGIVDRGFADTAGGAGTSGAVSLKLDGDVVASGRNGIAVFAQSRAADGQGDLFIELKADRMVFAGEGGEGLRLSGGADNRFVNRGAVITADRLTGLATLGEEGNDAIRNFGLFYGRFDLGGGTNTFVNTRKGELIAGPELMLGNAANLLVNDGIMRPGDMGLAQHTGLDGSLVQTATGITFAELDFGSDMLDRISMTGTATLAGEVDVSLLNPQRVKAGDFEKTLFSADMGVTDDGMFLGTAPSVVIEYELLYPTGGDAVLGYKVDFSPETAGGLGRNLREVGDYFNRIQNAGSSPALADTVIKLLYTPDMDAYRYLLSQLGPDFYGEQQAEMYRSSQRFGKTLADGGTFRFLDHDKLVWFNFATDSTTHDAFDDYKKTTHSSDSAAFGVQKMLQNQWIIGGGLAFENNDSSGYGGRWSSSGDTFHLGGVAKRNFDGTEVLGAVSWGRNDTDYKRIGEVTSPFISQASRELDAFTALARVSHVFEKGDFYIRPAFDLGLTYLNADGTTESGGGPTALELEDYSEVRSWIRPAVALGNVHTFASGLKLHLHAELGFQYFLGDDHTDVRAGFAGAPAGVSPMNVPIDLGSNIEATIGVQLIDSDNASIGLQYGKIIDENYDVDHWSLRLNVPF